MADTETTTTACSTASRSTRPRDIAATSRGSLEEDGRKAKRPRIVDLNVIELPHLTPDLWASAVSFLPYADMIQCTAVNRSFLHDVALGIKEIEVSSASEMMVAPARRFRAVHEITIGCLIRCRRNMHGGDRFGDFDVDSDYSDADDDVVSLVVPFLSQFPALRTVDMGGLTPTPGVDEPQWTDFSALDDEDERILGLMHGLILSLCGAYRSGLLSRSTCINGLCFQCRNASDHGDDDSSIDFCATCFHRCKYFPISEVADSFHASAFWRYCLPVKKAMEIVLKRPGGKALLSSPEYLLRTAAWSCEKTTDALKDLGLIPKVSRECFVKWFQDYPLPLSQRNQRNYERLKSLGLPVERSDFPIPFSVDTQECSFLCMRYPL